MEESSWLVFGGDRQSRYISRSEPVGAHQLESMPVAANAYLSKYQLMPCPSRSRTQFDQL